MTAEVIRFPVGFKPSRRIFRDILDQSELSEDAAEWIFADAWPRLERIYRNLQTLNFPEHDVANKAIEKVMNGNLLQATFGLLKLEIELYEARFGKPAGR